MTSLRIALCITACIFLCPSDAQAQRRGSRGGEGEQVSFTKEVAPIIVAKCGRCHVTGSKGQYGIASYAALMDSDSVVAGAPDESFFIEIIESGDMPKGGLKVDRKELNLLKQWIKEGAEFDGDDESGALANPRDERNDRAKGSSQPRRRTGGRRPSRSRSRRPAKPNAIKLNKFLAYLDENGDGELSLAEIDAVSRLLYSMDVNEDDRLTDKEVEEFEK